ncbi:MAG TPA: hypothetical protein VL069_14155, partial [Opitutus sp.]|nr:hypothetical protein [Opitutus sp.]
MSQLAAWHKRAIAALILWLGGAGWIQAADSAELSSFPLPLEAYGESTGSVLEILQRRLEIEPFNLVATLIFILAIVHTFLTAKFRHWAHAVEEAHRARLKERAPAPTDR